MNVTEFFPINRSHEYSKRGAEDAMAGHPSLRGEYEWRKILGEL